MKKPSWIIAAALLGATTANAQTYPEFQPIQNYCFIVESAEGSDAVDLYIANNSGEASPELTELLQTGALFAKVQELQLTHISSHMTGTRDEMLKKTVSFVDAGLCELATFHQWSDTDSFTSFESWVPGTESYDAGWISQPYFGVHSE
ncbi:hypothetical protein K2X30_15515 [bacterium]|jgi:hypothetical protein|nr:hypothetical protein [bacterium]